MTKFFISTKNIDFKTEEIHNRFLKYLSTLSTIEADKENEGFGEEGNGRSKELTPLILSNIIKKALQKYELLYSLEDKNKRK